MSKLTLLINQVPQRFISANVSFSIEQLAQTFECTLPQIKVDAPSEIEWRLDDTPIFKGQIDSYNLQQTESGETHKISGRSLCAHLIDSRIKLDAIYNQSFDQLLAKVIAPFGLSVVNQVRGKMPIVPEFQIVAESPLQNLAQIAKQQGLVLHEQLGQINIEKPGQFRVESLRLQESVNLQNITLSRNWSQLFHHIEIQGAWDGAEAIVKNPQIHSARTKVIVSDKMQTQESCQTRAQYEHDLAIAQSLMVSATVPGLHTQLTGQRLNQMVHVLIPSQQLDENLLIKSITLSVNVQSQSTQVSFMRPFNQGGSV